MPRYSPFFLFVHINIKYVLKYYHQDYFDQRNKQTKIKNNMMEPCGRSTGEKDRGLLKGRDYSW